MAEVIKTNQFSLEEANAAFFGRSPPRPVVFLVWDLDEQETIVDAARVLASDTDNADNVARSYAEQRDDDEGGVTHQRLLVVRNEATGVEVEVEVEAEHVVTYHARVT